MIEFDNVTKIYKGNIKAVDQVSLTVPQGSVAVFLGPSGCGKTTLLRMVNRLVPITDGNITVNGMDTKSLNEIELRRKIGYVIQSNGLFPNMTIEQNVTIVPNLLGWDRVKQRDRFNYLMDLVGMEPDQFRNRYPHELSGGQQQRVGIARAMAADPPVMLMDEPFGALDPIIRTHIQKEFLQIQQEVQKTILFVSHDIDEAIKMGDRIAIFKDGSLMQYDAPTELLAQPKNQFVQDFVGTDRSIKSLSLYTVADLLEYKKPKPVKKSSFNLKVDLDTSLREAMAMLFNETEQELLVVDKNNQPICEVTITDVQQYLQENTQTA
ncbi:ABC transporter ATP-binding protein [Texcoconibacillus texcoconensis]|uniref:Carnitine transport ATP-binding protein OpuCA n=1 Tax=Texcoconibacillus texcoconensis TaxID=1095777 RepID=A0A840QPM5_9BACI|nr:ABC transporter ATP-binding protein [Texcoconibacillus texcoconensis]MBB5173324.1 osmoprotectant transport system ATP-binding protein [Texcoconibacillus texcoconensis]